MSGYLLDTHAFLWLATDDPRLGERARELVLDPDSELFLSVGSVWEMAIKSSLGKLTLALPLGELVKGQCAALATTLLPVVFEHAAAVESLAYHHRDPFDRLLVAQALVEGMPVLSCDPALDAYGVRRTWD